MLDTGARVWTDPAEWFWGLRRWTRLLGETLLIAYVGTLTGTLGAFVGCFLCSRNLVRARLAAHRACGGCWSSAAPFPTSCSR